MALKDIGFGLGVLKALGNLVIEAAVENGSIVENGEAVKAFIAIWKSIITITYVPFMSEGQST